MTRTKRPVGDSPALLSRAEVAALFGVTPTAVTHWANVGRLACTRTLGGHRRYYEEEVRALLTKARAEPTSTA